MNDFAHDSYQGSSSPFIVWGQALLDDPHSALSDILSGRGAQGAQPHAEPDDFLADLVAYRIWQDERPRLTAGLDSALLDWLETHVEWTPAHINRFGTRAYAAQISDALKVAARLPMKITAEHLTRNQSTWDNRFRGLRWPGDIDLLRQFNLVLAQHQPDTRFASRWFASCDEAAWGSPYWQTSLSIGLIGLRKLPATADTVPESRVAAALARFVALALNRGVSTHKVQTTFQSRTAALTVLYPRNDRHWRDVWDQVLDDLYPPLASHVTTIRTDWLAHLPFCGGANGGQPQRRGQLRTYGSIAKHLYGLPDRTRHEKIESAIRRALSLSDELWEKTRELIRAHWNYASRSGDSYFAVRTTHNICDQLLSIRPSEPQLAEIQRWTLQAIEADADNAHVWDLWAKVLSALGQHEASISVRWESIRRFPDNCVLRSSLAETLLEHHRDALAESLLRETMRDFPGDVISRNILVKVLRCQGRQEEADAAFATFGPLAPVNPYVRSLAELPSTIWPEEIQVMGSGNSADRSVGIDVETYGRSELEPENERADGHRNIEAGSEISAYLGRLEQQIPVLERYFACTGRESSDSSSPEMLRPDEIGSEFELVAAHRVGFIEGSGWREGLENWAHARRSSYSARLLLSWRGQEGNWLDRAAMSKIAEEFPEHRRWNNWLCYGFIDEERRSVIRREERNRIRQEVNDGEDEIAATLWRGRLNAVYPALRPEEKTTEDRENYDPAALKRLLEDVAFAGAERALASISLS